MKQEKSFERYFKVVYPPLAIIFCLISFACILNTFDLDLWAACFNLLLTFPLIGMMLVLFRRFDTSAIIASIVVFIICYTDQLIYAIRLTHVRFSDLMLIKQAVRVANRYKPIWTSELTRRLVIVVFLCAFLVFVARYYGLRYRKVYPFITGLVFFTIGVSIIFSGILPHEPETFDFTSEAENKGLLYSWYCQYQESKLNPPEGYSKEQAIEILAGYTPEQSDPVQDINLIVIMNESLTDYGLLGKTSFDDPLPNIHSYGKNSFYGKLAVSVFGGGTCNTEYEFLTGHAMAFLPEGVMPYLQYVVDKENSIAWDMEELGYTKKAIHPYYSEEWNRTQVYRFLGFDQFISGVDFGNTVVTNGMRATARPSQNLISFGDGPLYVRGLISDQSCLERVLDESTGKSFVFTVTMQNHGGYEYEGEDFTNIEYVTDEDRTPEEQKQRIKRLRIISIDSNDKEKETYKVNQYLTCTNLSDSAFKMLTDKLMLSDQKTIVLMFGDHQPSLLIPEDYMAIDGFEEAMYYDVPYILWANYDIEFDAPKYTSPNYLSAILKKNAGLPLTEWDLFRLHMMEKYPVVTRYEILDKDYKAVDASALNDYAIVQYMRMFE